MADPITLGVAGAGLGAIADGDNPLRGAALGGLGGWAGGAAMGLGAAGSSAAGAGAANTAMYGALPGLSATAPGSQAAMLAAQTAEFGTPGLMATGEALAAPGGMQAGMYGMGNSLFGGSDSSKMMQAGSKLASPQQQQPQQRPMVAAPQMPQGQNATVRPYSPNSGNPSEFMPSQPELMYGYNRFSPFRR